MDTTSIGIICQVVFKAHAEKATGIEGVNFLRVEEDASQLIAVIQKLSGKVEVPFHSAPAGSPRGIKVVGSPCETCKTPMIQGKKGVYCLSCYKIWATKNKS